jgi:hypothetical protein
MIKVGAQEDETFIDRGPRDPKCVEFTRTAPTRVA